MPFTSKREERFLFSQKPKIAKKFAAETPKSAYAGLPETAPATPKKKSLAPKSKVLGSMGQ